MKDNKKIFVKCQILVVNCFQKLLSSWWRTTSVNGKTSSSELWIAFKNYYLRDEGQRPLRSIEPLDSCELLSKIIIFVMKDNAIAFGKNYIVVVNCFQKLLSSWWRTTSIAMRFWTISLWIAFKNYYLRDEGQLCMITFSVRWSCELLSKIIIFVMKDNWCNDRIKELLVVNCFQKLLSSWWRTTFPNFSYSLVRLWIAFKNYYLRDEGQLLLSIAPQRNRCELLSKIIIFVMKDNVGLKNHNIFWVVNCFQKLLSSWWRTTDLVNANIKFLLWIAFKNYYLRDEGQLPEKRPP